MLYRCRDINIYLSICLVIFLLEYIISWYAAYREYGWMNIMTIAANIKKLFNANKIPYRIFEHERTADIGQAIQLAGVDKSRFLRTEVLCDEAGVLLAVVPWEMKINFTKLKKLLQRDLIVLSYSRINRIFNDCEAGAHPPFGEPYHLPVLFDSSLENLDSVYFKAGSQTSIIQLKMDDFLYLHVSSDSQKLSFISNEKFSRKVYQATSNKIPEEYKNIIDSCAFPKLSNIASQVLRLIKQEVKETGELVNLITKNNVICEQVLNYANLPFFSRGDSVGNISNAISDTLGFEYVSHIALGIETSKYFDFNEEHNIYIRNFWKHTLHCATLAGHLASYIKNKHKIMPSIGYMVGLFHNFGFLLFAQLFPPEFKLLNKWLNMHPKTSVLNLEKRLLCMGKAKHILQGGHAKLGAWLLRYWEFPEHTWVVAEEHHNPNYQGKYSAYVNLIWIVNRILKDYKMGDGLLGSLSAEELDFLGMDLKIFKSNS